MTIEARNSLADCATVPGKARETRSGTWTATKPMVVEVALLVYALLAGTEILSAQAPAAPRSDVPFKILDNSFLLEEAFNQEGGIFQNILTFTRSDESGWEATFTQEWPIGSEKHQLSYTVPARLSSQTGIGDVLINYRYQALSEGKGRPALAPRLSVILPSGNEDKGLGNGVVGWQVNLPFSKQIRDVYLHWNAGMTYLPGVGSVPSVGNAGSQKGNKVSLLTPHLAASAIWRVRPMINLMFETFGESAETVAAAGESVRATTLTLSPGLRGGWDIGDHQVVVGLALPLSFSPGENDTALLGYFSYELPFKK